MLKLSSIFIIFLFFNNAFAIDVVVTKKNIDYNEIIDKNMIQKANASNLKRHCIPVSYNEIANKKFQATHYMKKGYVICTSDVKEYKKESVLFDFGAIQIEKHGEIIFENDDYLRIRKNNGEIEKIYKDGRLK